MYFINIYHCMVYKLLKREKVVWNKVKISIQEQNAVLKRKQVVEQKERYTMREHGGVIKRRHGLIERLVQIHPRRLQNPNPSQSQNLHRLKRVQYA
jgi:hypothetical protein